MSNHLMDIPTPGTGNSRLGWHVLKEHHTCPMKWFNEYLRPHPNGLGIGCVPKYTPQAMLTGSIVHAAMEAWYLEDYNTEAAMLAARAELEARADECATEEAAAEAWSEAQQLLTRHFAFVGPDSSQPESLEIEIARDEYGPLIERQFELDLGYNGYVFTSKIDLIGWHDGDLTVVEHKTCAANRRSAATAQYQIDGQITGELLCLQTSPLAEGRRVAGLVNLMIKGAAASKPSRELVPVDRSQADFDKFQADTVRKLKRIDDDIAEYKEYLKRGAPVADAASLVFDASPDGYTCMGPFGRRCTYYESCLLKGPQVAMWHAYTRPRTLWEQVEDSELRRLTLGGIS